MMKSLLTIKNYLILANIVLVVVLISLANLRVLPLQNIGDFGFFVGLIFLLALYRPGWSFLFFVGTIMLENINLAPTEIGLSLRPYQLIGLLTLLAVGIRYFTGRLGFGLPKFSKVDIFITIFLITGFASSIFALDRGVAFNQSLILLSFGALYFLTRIFIQNLSDLKRVGPFFLSSSVVVILYGIWQNWQFVHGGAHFEVMPGRPNASFAEPDWLGMFLVFLLSVVYTLIANWCSKKYSEKNSFRDFNFQSFLRSFLTVDFWTKRKLLIINYCLLIIGTYILLILTVSRSAWLGAIVITLIFCGYVFWKKEYLVILRLAMAFLLSIGIIYVFSLTDFELGKRLQSTAGKQEITVACDTSAKLQNNQIIQSISELENYGCWHINLEDIDKEKEAGNAVMKVYRADPNVNIRAEIYGKSWEQIKKHPIMGIGWGNISQILGTDENGNGLNSSNIFLEIWLGSGLLGVTAFILALLNVVYGIFRSKNEMWKLFGTLGFFAIIIPNLFNAGIMLGFLWVWLGVINTIYGVKIKS